MKKLLKEYKTLWVSYLVIGGLIFIGMLIPAGADIIYLWGWLFYVPFIFGGSSLYGLLMIILFIPCYEAVVKNGIRASWDSIMIGDITPSLGCGAAYLAGASITKYFQNKSRKKAD